MATQNSKHLSDIHTSFLDELKSVESLHDLANLKSKYLGKQGLVSNQMRLLSKLDALEKKALGQALNELKSKLEQALDDRQTFIESKQLKDTLSKESVDLSLPAKKPLVGSLHPLTLIENKLVDLFLNMGFCVADGPEMESKYYNFEALNFPSNHPAMDMQDTLFLESDLLLRTHTSPVQVRYMQVNKPPFSIIVPGRVYRHDSDTTHSPVFHQIEGLCVGHNVTVEHLKGTLENFAKALFGQSKVRFRPSFFPFTEPSLEVDVMGKNGWMEIMGCGMVDPNVFKNVSKAWEEKGLENPYDAEKISGFAFGLGVERICMLLNKIEDIRLFYENDQRFLRQFSS